MSTKKGSKTVSNQISHGGSNDINIVSCELFTRGPDVTKFKPEELKIFDPDGFTRMFLKIKFKDMNDAIFDGMRSITRLQYALPVKYLKPDDGTYSYISQKSYTSIDNDIKNASITIEPLNPSYAEMIPYTPINQHLPLNTSVTIDVSVPYDTFEDGTEPDRKFIWSNNLRTDPNIEEVIKSEYPKSVRTKPWQECVHYGSIDIGSKFECKFLVALSDPKIYRSYNLYGFRFDHEEKELVIWTFKCFNVTPMEVLVMLRDNKETQEPSKNLINAILENVKGEFK